VQTITSSVDFVTGSTRFGSISANTHVYTGSVSISGSSTFSSTITQGAIAAPSYGGGGSGINLGYFNLQNVVATQASYANNVFYDGAVWKSVTSTISYAQAVRLQNGNIDFHNATVSTSGQTMSNWDSTDVKMRITVNGSVGIGISSPLAKLHVETSTATDGIYLSRSTSNKQTILLSADDGVGAYIAGNTTPAGNASQTDGAGRLILQGGSTEGFQFQTSYVTAATAASWTTRMVIKNGGNVGIGTTTPVTSAGNTKTLQIGGSTIMQSVVNDQTCFSDNAYYDGTSVWKYITANKAAGIRVGAAAAGDITFHTAGTGTVGGTITAWDSTGIKMTITNGGNIGAPSGTNIYNASDIRLKQNITTITNGLDKISALNPVKFNWVDGFEPSEDGKDMLGFIAQEVQDIIPEAVENFGKEGNIVEIDNLKVTNPLRVNEKFIIPVLVKAIQELKTQNDALQSRIETLESK
jgi:hypothetical protein